MYAGLLAALVLAVAGMAPSSTVGRAGPFAPSAATAAIGWPAPPRCVNSQWVFTGRQIGLYSKAGEYVQRRFYGGGTELRYIWVFYVEVPSTRGMLPGGRAERHCGTRWVPGWA
jgi:hypothetical protein